MSASCSAPIEGHHSAGSFARCPVHRKSSGSLHAPQERLPSPSGIRERREEAQDAGTSPRALSALAEDSNWYVRRAVAGNPSAPPETLRMLAVTESSALRKPIAANPSAPAETLTGIASTDGGISRRIVAQNPSAPAEALAIIASSPHPEESAMGARAINARIVATLGVDESNSEAIDALRDQAWWEMTPESTAVVLTKALFPNQ